MVLGIMVLSQILAFGQEAPAGPVAMFEPDNDWVNSVAFSPDGKVLASAHHAGVVHLWDVAGQKEMAVLGEQPVFGAKLKHGVELDDGIITKDLREEFEDNELPLSENATVSTQTEGSEWQIIDGGQIYNMRKEEELNVYQGHTERVQCVAFSPDSKTLASGSLDGTIILWHIQPAEDRVAEQLVVLQGHKGMIGSVAFSPDGNTLASGGWDTTVRLWDVAEQKQVGLLEGHSQRVNSVAFSPDGKTLASGSLDKKIRLWDVQGQNEMGVLEGHKSIVTSVAFSPNGKTLASGSHDSTVRLWDVAGQSQVTQLEVGTRVNSIAIAPDGKFLALGGLDIEIRIWDIGAKVQTGMLEGHEGSVYGVAISKDGKWLGSGSKDFNVALWEVNFVEESVGPMEKQLGTWGGVKISK